MTETTLRALLGIEDPGAAYDYLTSTDRGGLERDIGLRLREAGVPEGQAEHSRLLAAYLSEALALRGRAEAMTRDDFVASCPGAPYDRPAEDQADARSAPGPGPEDRGVFRAALTDLRNFVTLKNRAGRNTLKTFVPFLIITGVIMALERSAWPLFFPVIIAFCGTIAYFLSSMAKFARRKLFRKRRRGRYEEIEDYMDEPSADPPRSWKDGRRLTDDERRFLRKL